MSNIALFGNMPESYKRMMEKLAPETNLVGSGGAGRRLSIRGAVFRKVHGGEEVAALPNRSVDIVIVKAAPVSRTFFDGPFIEGENKSPTCWSADTRTPAPEVLASDRQSRTCAGCPQDIKGSGAGETRACRYQQRMVVVLADEISAKEPYLLSLPATSLFGDDKGKMGMQAYARHLQAHHTPAAAIVTEMTFDTSSSTPKLMFKPVRPLEEDELATILELQSDPDTDSMLVMTVAKKAESIAAPAAEAPLFPTAKAVPKQVEKPAAKPTSKAPVVEEEEEISPKIRSTKKAEPVVDTEDLGSILDGWDDE